MLRTAATLSLFLTMPFAVSAQEFRQTVGEHEHRFRQLDEVWPAPNDLRLATGRPGPAYWQQEIEYQIEAELDEVENRVEASGRLTYHNQSPHTLDYIWLEMPLNRHRADSISTRASSSPWPTQIVSGHVLRLRDRDALSPGTTLNAVRTHRGHDLQLTWSDTFVRVDLARPLAAGDSVQLDIHWSTQLPDIELYGSRAGFACPETQQRCVYQLAHWYPRPVAYTDYAGWSLEPFLGNGEFATEFGTFDVTFTAPADMVVTATGALANPREALSGTIRQRMSSDSEVDLIDREEAAAAANADIPNQTRDWRFRAENVRDFALAASAAYGWRHLPSRGEGPSYSVFYLPTDADYWRDESLHIMRATTEALEPYFGDYPYPHVTLASGAVPGMEHPGLAFVGSSDPHTDDPEREHSSWMLSTVHEVAHNFTPMLLNIDERNHGWMDEGFTTFFEARVLRQIADDYPLRRGEARHARNYMQQSWQTPVMTRQDDARSNINHAYVKPAAALSVLRELVLGPEVFDQAFREYAAAWRYRRATPYDFFRHMESASGRDLDWFWRGWFYTTDNVELALDNVALLSLSATDPLLREGEFHYLLEISNAGGLPTAVPVRITHENGDTVDQLIAPEFWRHFARARRALITTDQPATRFELDPDGLTADIDPENQSAVAPFEHREATSR